MTARLKMKAEDVGAIVAFLRERLAQARRAGHREAMRHAAIVSKSSLDQHPAAVKLKKLKMSAVRRGYKVEIPIEVWRDVVL